ncbi:hypothetical protein ZIOFF_031885 [Zingiber officinale]|uniref:Uncharacterized protein n=1 Tax=Zingiber officinale TaxID=94328 RepID=A0A8J5GFR9_ZINOF|nr:hypothetical protein ZIOFF_031885 [Zingiber officinale]
MKEKLIAGDLEHSRAEQLKEVSTSSAKAIHSPLNVRSRGHPPTKRKQSKIEQIVKKSVVKARKKGVAGSDPTNHAFSSDLWKNVESCFTSVTLDNLSEVASSKVASVLLLKFHLYVVTLDF